MKKLLSLLGAFGLTASASATVVACGSINNNDSEPDIFNEKEMSLVLGQVAKTAYLNKEKSYDENSIFRSNVTGKLVSDLENGNIDVSELEPFTRYSEISSKYFDGDIFNNDIEYNYAKQSIKNDKVDLGSLQQLVNFGPIIFESLLDPDVGLLGIVALVQDMGLISQFIEPEMFSYLKDILSKDKIQNLSDAFNDDYYKDLTYQQVLNSAMLGLSNTANAFTKSEKRYDYKSGKPATVEVMKEALNGLGEILGGMFSGKTKMAVDIIDGFDGITELIRSIRLIINYINLFDLSKSQTFADIQKQQEKTFDSTDIDIKKFIDNLSKALKSENGDGIRGLLQILFASREGGQITGQFNLVMWNNLLVPTPGLSGLIYTIGNAIMPPMTVETGISLLPSLTVVFGNAFNEIVNIGSSKTKGSIEKLVSVLNPIIGNMEGDVKNIFTKLNDYLVKTKDEYNYDLFSILYSGELLPTLLGEDSKFGKLKNLQTILKTPLREFGVQGGLLSPFGKKSTDSLINELNIKLQSSDENTLKISPKKMKTLFDSLIADDTWTDKEGVVHNGFVLEHALSDPDNLFIILGLIAEFENIGIKENSPLFHLEEVLRDLIGLKELLTYTGQLIEEHNKRVEEVDKELKKDFEELKINSVSVNGNEFIFKINETEVKINIEKSNTLYKIKSINI